MNTEPLQTIVIYALIRPHIVLNVTMEQDYAQNVAMDLLLLETYAR